MIPVHDVRATAEGREDGRFDRNQSLKEALERLPDEQREVVVLRHVAGLSPAEIAHRMKRTESSIHGLHHRGRRALRTTLRELDTTPAVRSRLVPGQLATCAARVRVEVAR
jgi:RNA polymerase sigma-70 factor (ECF subfamily)